MQFEIPENFVFKYPWAPSTVQGAFCICVSCGEKSQCTQKISEYPFRWTPRHWHVEARTSGIRCPQCAKNNKFQPDFYAKYEVHISHDGEIPHLHVRPRERMWMDVGPQTAQQVQQIPHEGHTATRDMKETAMDKDAEMTEASATEGSTRDMKTRAKDHFGEVGSALALGVKLAAVNEGGEILLDIAKEIAKDSPMMEALLESPDGREVAKMLTALTISGMCHYTDYVPKKEVVANLMAMQMTASGFVLAGPRMKQLRKHFEKLVGVGEKLADLGEQAGAGVAAKTRVASDVEDAEEAEVESIDSAKAKKHATA